MAHRLRKKEHCKVRNATADLCTSACCQVAQTPYMIPVHTELRRDAVIPL